MYVVMRKHYRFTGFFFGFKESCLQIGNGIFLALSLLLTSIFLGFYLYHLKPGIIQSLMSIERWEQLHAEIEQIFIVHDQGLINSISSFLRIFGHNILLGFLAFIGGSFMGVISIYLLLFNGLIIGIILALLLQYHGIEGLHSTVFLHGTPEILALTGCAAIGFHLVRRLFLKKGIYTREIIKDTFKAGFIRYSKNGNL